MLTNVSCVFHDYVRQVVPLELARLWPAREYLVWSGASRSGLKAVTTLPGVPEPPASSALAFTALRRDHGAALVTFHWAPQPVGDTNGPGFR
jgi:hypothetical protein